MITQPLAVEPGKIGQAVIESIPILAKPVGKLSARAARPRRPVLLARPAKSILITVSPAPEAACSILFGSAVELADIGLFGVGKVSCCHPDKPLRILRNVR